MRKAPEEKFADELSDVKAKLPKRYMGAFRVLYPNKFKDRDVYNVINYGTKKPDILEALKKLIKTIEAKKKIS